MNGPTWLDESETDEKYIAKLEKALSLAWDTLQEFSDYDPQGNRNSCDFHLRHDEHSWAQETLKKIEGLK
jgi:hypothetical protein